ncbi:MAG: carbohydrate kinase family protein [Anaerolineaceae bacterium]|nr:carbohydrate kinase family protein [Anaerolineaceae bacterium]
MKRILVSGLINIETSVKVESFPIHYSPVTYPFFEVNTTVSGVGYNVAKALRVLENQVSLLSIVGKDQALAWVKDSLTSEGISNEYIIELIEQTPQSVIMYDDEGRRRINVDLKDIQEKLYPQDEFRRAMGGCELLILCNINFSRPMLKIARQAGKLIATDVHTIGDLEDAYNRDFMQAADILFMSNENLPVSPEEWGAEVMQRYQPEILVIGLGDKGALLSVRQSGFCRQFPVVQMGEVISTIGAGDALFAAFVHSYLKNRNPIEAIQKAIIFASYKVRAVSASDGFLDPESLEELYENLCRE